MLSDCTHENRLNDVLTGDTVCISCGLVLDQFLGNDEQSVPSSSSPPRAVDDKLHSAWRLYTRDHILYICSVLNVESSLVVDCALDIFHQLAETGNFSKRRLKCPEMVYAIWEAFNRQGTPKSPKAIADICGIPSSAVLTVEKKYRLTPTYCLPSSTVHTTCAILHIPWKVSTLVETLVAAVEELYYGHNPETLVVCCLISVLQTMMRVDAANKSKYQSYKESCITYFFPSTRTAKICVLQRKILSQYEIIEKIAEDKSVRHKLIFKNTTHVS